MPEEIAGSPQFHALVAVAPTGQKGVPLENRQVSQSKARAIREDAGQAGKGFGPQGCSSPGKQQRVVRDNRLVLLTLTAKTNLPPVERLVPTCSLRIRSQKKYRTPLPPRVDESRHPKADNRPQFRPVSDWATSKGLRRKSRKP
jgi:hypothetical protein